MQWIFESCNWDGRQFAAHTHGSRLVVACEHVVYSRQKRIRKIKKNDSAVKQNHSFFVMCQPPLPHTVRIYESIRRIPSLSVCNLWNSLKRDTVGRFCDAVANRYLCPNRNIFRTATLHALQRDGYSPQMPAYQACCTPSTPANTDHCIWYSEQSGKGYRL